MNSNFDELRSWAKKNKVNQLTSLNDEQLVSLKSLDISNKGLTTLPDSISQLVQLEELWIQNNNIKLLPKGLGLLPNLETFAKFDNPITRESEKNFYAELAQDDFGEIDELGLIRATFARYFCYWSTLLPRTAIKNKKRGAVGNKEECWPLDIRYLFGKNKKGLYLDYHFEDRRAGESHDRIYANGEVERLETINPYRHSSHDPAEDKRLQEEYHAENSRIYDILKSKGFANY